MLAAAPSWLEGVAWPEVGHDSQEAPQQREMHKEGPCKEAQSWVVMGKSSKWMDTSNLGLREQGWEIEAERLPRAADLSSTTYKSSLYLRDTLQA